MADEKGLNLHGRAAMPIEVPRVGRGRKEVVTRRLSGDRAEGGALDWAAARSLVANGIDPADKKRRDKRAAKVSAHNTFGAGAKDYIAKNRRDGLSEATVVKDEWFVRLVQLSLGGRPMSEIQPSEILDAVRPFEAAKDDEKAHRTFPFICQVFRYAVANQIVANDSTSDLRGNRANRKPKNLAAILQQVRPRGLNVCLRRFVGQAARLGPTRHDLARAVQNGRSRQSEPARPMRAFHRFGSADWHSRGPGREGERKRKSGFQLKDQ